MKNTDYEKLVVQALWNWADLHYRDELDGGNRQGRPPVFRKPHELDNVLTPPDDSIAQRIRAVISKRQRHQWFGSMKSSQALCQSVFGAIAAFERFDLLQSLPAECGRPAFFEDHHGFEIQFEHEVKHLGEPRRTSVDVMFHGLIRRIAAECKFMERDFGTCSRPRMRPIDPRYFSQHCDGSYRIQRDRHERCSLTEIGIRYWEYLPHLFDWASDRDHERCPFEVVYQLARNALAATVAPDGTLEPCGGHVLLVYDARNPAFRINGKADQQWRSAIAACSVPGLLRRLSWQRLVSELARAPELTYLVDAIGMKYGLKA